MASIQGIYLALFGRPADPAGLAYFNTVTKNGTDLAGIANLAGQPEYTARFTGMNNSQIVTSIFQSLFGRAPDQAGLDFFVGKLASGALNINNIAINILDGAQGNDKAVLDAKVAAADLFTAQLDTPAEIAAYNSTTVALARAYIESINTTKAGNAADITSLIQTIQTSGGQAPGGNGGGGGGTDPANQPATISGASTGDVYEDGQRPEEKVALRTAISESAHGQLTSVDPDGTVGFTASTTTGTHGTLTIDAEGNWEFNLANESAAVQSLGEGTTAVENFTVASADGTPHVITINIHGANDRATISGNAEGSVAANSDSTGAEGTLSVEDADTGENVFQAVTEESLAGKYGSFEFNPATGKWSYTLDQDAAKSLGGDAVETDSLTVTSKDGTDHQTITVAVNGANDAPTFDQTSYNFSINENATGPVSGDFAISAAEVDDGDSVTYSFAPGYDGPFEINSVTGVISLSSALNHEGDQESYELTVVATDTNSASTSVTVTVAIADVNDAPTGQDQTVTVLEDGRYVLAESDFGFADEDSGHSLSAVTVNAPSAGVLSLDDIAITAETTVSVSDIQAGKLIYTPPANGNGTAHASFEFKVLDSSGSEDGSNIAASSNKITFDVTPVNDAPSGADSTITILEDGSHTFAAADFGFTDSVDGDSLDSVIVTAVSAGGHFKLGATEVAVGDKIAASDIEKLVFTPAANAFGNAYAALSFKVVDNGGTANDGINTALSANTITFNVTSVNDKPVISATPVSNPLPSVAENTTAATTIATGVSATDVEDGVLKVALSGTHASLFTLTGGVLKLNPNIDFEALATAQSTFNPNVTVTLTATDKDGESATTQTFNVNITDVRETATAANTRNAEVSKVDSYGAWNLNGHTDSGQGDNGVDIITGGKANDIIRGYGQNDTINLGSGGSDKVIFEASASANGVDAINGFKGGALASGGDILDFTNYLGKSGSMISYTANPGSDTALASGKIVLLTDRAGGQDISTASGLADALRSTTGGEYGKIDAVDNGKYVFITAASANNTSVKVFYAEGNHQGGFDNVTLVGTVDGTKIGDFTAVNFA